MRRSAVLVLLLSGVLPGYSGPDDTSAAKTDSKPPLACCLPTVEKDRKPEKVQKKYFVELLHLNSGSSKPSGGIPQSITLNAVCYDSADAKKKKLPCSNAVKNGEIDVTAASDSGLPVCVRASLKGVSISIAAGKPFAPKCAGKLIVDATQSGSAKGAVKFAPAPPMRLEIDISDKLTRPPAVCAGLGQPAARPLHGRLDASATAKVLGNSEPFIVEPQGKDYLAVYAKRPVKRWELNQLVENANRIAQHSPAELGVQGSSDPFVAEMKIPHAVAFGDLAQKVSTLNFADFKVENAGVDNIRIDCAGAFLRPMDYLP